MSGARKRGANFQAPFLTRCDEYVPDTHIGIYELFHDQKEAIEWRMRKEQIDRIRKETYSSVCTLFNKYGATEFDLFYNVHADEISALGINRFVENKMMAPIANLVECFQTKWKSNNTHKIRRAISFGISYDVLEKYAAAISESKQNGTPLVIPDMKSAPSHKNISKRFVMFGNATIDLGMDNRRLTCERNALYNQFEHWCSVNGVSKREGALMALECLIKDYPSDKVGQIEQYHVVTEFDKSIAVLESGIPDQQKNITFSGALYAKTMDIIRHYNADPRNITRGKITFSSYCNNALLTLNKKMPLKYTDPESYDQLVQLKKASEYNSGDDNNGTDDSKKT